MTNIPVSEQLISRWERAAELAPRPRVDDLEVQHEDLMTRLGELETRATGITDRISNMVSLYPERDDNCLRYYSTELNIRRSALMPIVNEGGKMSAELFLRFTEFCTKGHSDVISQGWQVVKSQGDEEPVILQDHIATKPFSHYEDYLKSQVCQVGFKKMYSKYRTVPRHSDNITRCLPGTMDTVERMGYRAAMTEYDRLHMPLHEDSLNRDAAVLELAERGLANTQRLLEKFEPLQIRGGCGAEM